MCRALDSNFNVSFDEQITVSIIEVPNSIELQVIVSSHIYIDLLLLQLIDTSSTFPVSMATVYVSIPDTSTTTSNAPKEVYQFSSNNKVTYNHAGVGSGQLSRY